MVTMCFPLSRRYGDTDMIERHGSFYMVGEPVQIRKIIETNNYFMIPGCSKR